MKVLRRIVAAIILVPALVALVVPLGRRDRLPVPITVHGRAALQQRSDVPVEVGAEKMTIEVPRESPLAGYAGWRRAEHDGRVHVRALVLRSGDLRAIVVALDSLLVSAELEEEVLRRAQLPPRTCLLLAGTHTHSGPGGTWHNAIAEVGGNGRFDHALRDSIAQTTADAIRGALGYLRAGRLAVAQVEWADGPARVRSAGPVDPTLFAMQARDESGVVVATLAAYGMHPTVLPSEWHTASGDWPGAAARAIEQETQAPALVLQGAGANATWSRDGLPAESALAAEALGNAVAQRTLDLLETSAWADGAPLSCEVTLHSLPPAQASVRVPWPLRRAASNLLALWAPAFAVRTQITVGGARLSGIPGELVGSLALAAVPEHFIGLADGYVGYVEDPARAQRGEGEAGRTYYGPGLARALGVLEER
ncbi:MAG TPA: neutral/alkaline non-lysosomal ceramidase N-terminal domain-containing protein [Myxococcales bacterium]|nr:neutral/alkaline non-lysosomal ceramidase N-terminal domain-containing protein [Myxococcales bacterium]